MPYARRPTASTNPRSAGNVCHQGEATENAKRAGVGEVTPPRSTARASKTYFPAGRLAVRWFR